MECRGTRDSEDTKDGYSLAQFASDVVTLMSQIGIDKFTYAGHSMGGGIGYLLGLEYAERLSRLILMASATPLINSFSMAPYLRQKLWQAYFRRRRTLRSNDLLLTIDTRYTCL